MIPRLFLVLLASVPLLVTGCGMFSKKDARPKESSAIAADNEEIFRRRWVEQRSAQLVAQGTEANAARQQAENEFRTRFGFNPPKK